MHRRDCPSRASAKLICVSLARRRLLQGMLLPAASWIGEAWGEGIRVSSSRLWPAPDYTRLIVESDGVVGHSLAVLRNPDRLVLDIEGVEFSTDVALLPMRVQASDPYVAGIRVARRSSMTTRIVLDLKSEVRPDLFLLPPVAEYGHRLVLDL